MTQMSEGENRKSNSLLTEEMKMQLTKLLLTKPLFDEPIAFHTTIKVGGPADALVTIHRLDELLRLLSFSREHRLPLFVLGGGSNIIVRDGGIRGIVVRLNGEFTKVSFNGAVVRAGGGASLYRLVNMAADMGLSGLEPVVGVPGTVGGAIVSNAGTAVEFIGDRVLSVHLLGEDGTQIEVDGKAILFGYRYSNVLDFGKFILAATLELKPSSPGRVRKSVEKLLEHRRRTQPINMPSAGCIFKNPPNEHAGKLIDMAKLKGFRCGRAQVSEVHANFIINLGGATAREVIELIEIVRKAVYERFGVMLEYEVQIIGEE
ncbi:MAG: UDP-N-acetylmuramate dehydrogenase [Armatimonadota bacterium]|nr:UDP-N-acetylmuramate dehydrogenase [Armatimonadota bacterium]MCX7777573.1 UDP-N-acetylmuramate dehydrogenase [Armatimonadota bacterium]MDW8025582.1 UDP-N-acetylmuramate dehydrogenase [Armatimonadota bacterium]